MADEPRWGRVEDPAQSEAAARCHRNDLLLVIGRPPLGQRCEMGSFQLDPLSVVGILSADDLVDEAAIGIKVVEVSAPAQQQRVLQRFLEMAVWALDRPVLVRDAGIVAGRRHSVVAHERLVALRQVLLSIPVEVTERGRQAVAAVLERYAAESPHGVLQALGQRHEGLAAEHDVGMCEAREGEAEVVEPMLQHDAGDADAELTHLGEVGEAEAAGLMLLPEDHILLRSRQSSPRPHPSFQRAADAWIELGMAPSHLSEYTDGPDTWCCLEDRQNLGVPIIGGGG